MGLRRVALRLMTTLLACALAAPALVIGQPPPASAPRGPGHVLERQQALRDRIQRLENRMLELSRLLAEREPAKAERLRDGLEHAGRQQIRTRIEKLIELLRSEQFSDADRSQQVLLADLESLLELLTSSRNELDRRREERERLEALQRAIRVLIDEQTQHLYRTRHAGQQLERQTAEGAGVPRELADMLRQLEQMQRDTQRKAADLRGQMDPGGPPNRATPGQDALQRAERRMQSAADRLGEQDASAAGKQEEEALQDLHKASDELDDALRQVRREEAEETLAALESRFRQMLTRERGVRETVGELAALTEAGRAQPEAMQRLRETSEQQRQVAQQAEHTLAILVDEGTTVIVPELVRQMAGDMATVAERLAAEDVAAGTQAVLDDILALLEEIVGVLERERDEMSQRDEGQPGDEDRRQPLLPGSAELKLLRSSQLRLNERTCVLQGAWQDRSEAGATTAAAEAARLGQRQQRLAELARQMNERKP